MSWTMILAAVMLVAFALIYLMGTTVYQRYDGQWNPSAVEIGVFVGLWAFAYMGLIAATVEMLVDLIWWQPALITVTVSPLIPTALASSLALAGVTLNVVILIRLFWPRRSSV